MASAPCSLWPMWEGDDFSPCFRLVILDAGVLGVVALVSVTALFISFYRQNSARQHGYSPLLKTNTTHSYGAITNAESEESDLDDDSSEDTLVNSIIEEVAVPYHWVDFGRLYAFAQAGLYIFAVCWWMGSGEKGWPLLVSYASGALVWSIASIGCICQLIALRSAVPTASSLRKHLNIFFVTALLVSFIDLRTYYIADGFESIPTEYILSIVNTINCIILFLIVGNEPNRDDRTPEFAEDGRVMSKENKASMLSWSMFSWVNPMMQEGWKRTLNDVDLFEMPDNNRAKNIVRTFRKHRVASLTISLYYTFQKELHLQTVYAFFWSVLLFGPPFFLNRIVTYVEHAHDETQVRPFTAYLYVFGLFVTSSLQSLALQQALYIGRTLGVRIQAIVTGEVYRKSLKRRDTAGASSLKTDEADTEDDKKEDTKEEKSQGNINNLLSVDAQKIAELTAYVFYIYSYPIQVLVALWSLWRLLGISAVFGVATIIITYPGPHYMNKLFEKTQNACLSATDKRIKLVNELLGAIRIVKFFAWEREFRKRVEDAREAELKTIHHRLMIYLWSGNVWFIVPIIIMSTTFLAYTKVFGNELTAAIAFTALALFNTLRGALDEIPFIIMSVLQAKVSIKRVSDFLDEEEVTRSHLSTYKDQPNFIGFKDDASFQWYMSDETQKGLEESGSEPFALRNLNISFPLGKLSVVCGPTGCGKTTLLASLMGETNRLHGQAVLPRRKHAEEEGGASSGVAYVSQTAWLQNETIKNNILFGLPFDEDRYNKVLYMCALTRDLEILEHGDQTEVGEKGITLSGGQKQRLAIARAVYSQADIIIMDDCLSAVDAHTAKHLFEECLMGDLMINRTRILVTHHVGLCLKKASHIVVMKDGDVVGNGVPLDVLKTGVLGDELRGKEEEIADANEESAVEGNIPVVPKLVGKKSVEGEGKLVQDEVRQEGGVSWDVYKTYFNASGGFLVWMGIFILFSATEVLVIGQDWWIKVWASAYNTANTSYFANSTIFSVASMPFGNHEMRNVHHSDHFASNILTSNMLGEPSKVNVDYYLGIYFLIGIITMVVGSLRSWLLYAGSVAASRKLHARLLDRILRAKVRFFDTTPLGRILNRFSSDMDTVDQNVAPSLMFLLYSIVSTVGVVILVSYVTPLFLVPGIFITIVFAAVGIFYLRTSRDMKRLNSVAKSPIYIHFNETVAGVSTIRAFGAENRFVKENLKKIDNSNRPFIWMWATNRWLHCRVDAMGAFVSFCTGFVILLSVQWIDPGLAGLSLSYALTFTHHVLWVVRMYAVNEMNLNAIERVQEYLDLDEEPHPIIPENRPPPSWPTAGEVEVKNLVMQYAPENSPVLRDISFKVNAREKVGIVGRTGSGKSTLAISLFRFMEPTSGSVLIDGVDIHKIGLEDLRSKLTIIPQDPVLFSGTLRSNLDPFDQHDDAKLWTALKRAHLIDEDNTNGEIKNLEAPVSENGSNFSQGQRQLIALARALVKRSKLIIMDEATSSVDFDTDHKIQQTIREEFVDSSLLCVAHRIRTVADYDRILVLDHGQIMEYDTPYNLMSKEDGLFRSMCERSGEFNELYAIAEAAHNRT
ncbi:hypothetical protein BZG36_00075 [Bifiguratus adelaidae]|uniref:Uncharacterized protein n=1 Tax=Bifiguratus adelaidae TaxID=1938954 RepID=A0A261Y8K6_9FUNG|nr:hypothetical protein BZG36_00075 [Bifiguratus adelaidae]